jgi:hypothetical protein
MQAVADRLGVTGEEVRPILIEMTAMGELASQTVYAPGVWVVHFHAPSKWIDEAAALKRMREAS